MSQGKYLSLEEARKLNRLKKFAEAHPSSCDEKLFEQLFNSMAKGKPPKNSKASGKT